MPAPIGGPQERQKAQRLGKLRARVAQLLPDYGQAGKTLDGHGHAGDAGDAGGGGGTM